MSGLRATAIVTLLWTVAPTKISAQERTAPHWDQFRAELEGVRALFRVPGMAVVVVDNGRIAWSASLGWADLEQRVAVSSTTLFPVASLTKTMTAVAIMQLVAEQRLSLDVDVVRIATSSKLPAGIRVEHVLSHTSEIGPGEEYLYSGARFNTLTAVVEAAGTEPYADALRRRVVGPARMTHTIVPGTSAEGAAADVAKPYDLDPAAPNGVRVGTPATYAARAASGVLSTAEDLGRYLIALDAGTLLDSGSTVRMTTAHRTSRGVALPYALGWFTQMYHGETLRWHYGQEISYGSLLLWLPRRHLGLAVLANSAAMSDAARLLDGNVARSLVAQEFLRSVVGLPRVLDVDADEKLAQALGADFVGDRDGADSLTRAALVEAPSLTKTADLPLLFLLARLNDRRFDTAATNIADAILLVHPRLPPALYFAAIAATHADDNERARRLLERIAAIPDPPRSSTVVLGLTDLGMMLVPKDPSRARDVLERVVAMNLNYGGAVDRARVALASLPRN